MNEQHEIPLTQAAHRLRIHYNLARDFAIAGRIQARQTVTGRWLCSADSVEQLRQQLESGGSPKQAA